MPEAVELCCHRCGAGHEIEGPLSRSTLCSSCGVELRCCLNCRFYDRSAYNECGEPAAERVVEKERANFCDHFTPGPSVASGSPAGKPGSMGDLEKLFKR